MRKVILDTNFILTCIKQKIDFFEEIKLMGMQILIPRQVIEEIERIADSKKKLHFREDAKLSLRLFKKNIFKKIDLKKRYVDKALIKFAKENPEFIVATLDKELKKKIKNNKLVIREKKKLEII
jgi:rRNA-processing protein FCF1